MDPIQSKLVYFAEVLHICGTYSAPTALRLVLGAQDFRWFQSAFEWLRGPISTAMLPNQHKPSDMDPIQSKLVYFAEVLHICGTYSAPTALRLVLGAQDFRWFQSAFEWLRGPISTDMLPNQHKPFQYGPNTI